MADLKSLQYSKGGCAINGKSTTTVSEVLGSEKEIHKKHSGIKPEQGARE